ncbi:uncharacterized protein LOC125759365 [Rhipicephalus sanguineus]|uniref:uncharacterized protein LOC125759365 n=1 Tax=Rhipicephalus sanguineus TaxID=34632 RepID=UPI0020C4E54A|nr:uncharacterized protein LOC125759365 [Rhipicephalus sanguineus]
MRSQAAATSQHQQAWMIGPQERERRLPGIPGTGSSGRDRGWLCFGRQRRRGPGMMGPRDNSQAARTGDRARVILATLIAAIATSRTRSCPLASTSHATSSWSRPRQLKGTRLH